MFWIFVILALKGVFLQSPIKYFSPKWQEIEIPDGQVRIGTAISELKIAKTQTFWSPVYMYLGKLHES